MTRPLPSCRCTLLLSGCAAATAQRCNTTINGLIRTFGQAGTGANANPDFGFLPDPQASADYASVFECCMSGALSCSSHNRACFCKAACMQCCVAVVEPHFCLWHAGVIFAEHRSRAPALHTTTFHCTPIECLLQELAYRTQTVCYSDAHNGSMRSRRSRTANAACRTRRTSASSPRRWAQAPTGGRSMRRPAQRPPRQPTVMIDTPITLSSWPGIEKA